MRAAVQPGVAVPPRHSSTQPPSEQPPPHELLYDRPERQAGQEAQRAHQQMTPTNQPTNSGEWVGSVPALAGTRFFAARLPAIARVGHDRARSARSTWRSRAPCCRTACSPTSPANALPLLLPADENAYSTSLKPCGPLLKMPATPAGVDDRDGRAHQHGDDRDQHDQRRHLHLERLDLLAEVFRRAADHQARPRTPR